MTTQSPEGRGGSPTPPRPSVPASIVRHGQHGVLVDACGRPVERAS